MLYTITKSEVKELDMPVYTAPQLPHSDCAVVFTTENTAKFFAEKEPDANQLAVAELRGIAIIKLLAELHEQGVTSVLVDPRPDDGTHAPARSLATDQLIDIAAGAVLANLKSMDASQHQEMV